VSVLVLGLALKRRYLFTGWFWYLGTLVPVIGLVQVGSQSMADRYAYVPVIGLFIITAWGLNDLLAKWRHRNVVLGLSSLAVLLALSICTYFQVRYWRDTITIFEHALEVAPESDTAHINLGVELMSQRKFEQALSHYNRALQLNPKYPKTYNNLGIALKSMGRLNDAVSYYRKAVELDPNYVEAYNNLANALRLQGKLDEAVDYLRRALRLNPDIPDIHYNLGLALQSLNNPEEAISCFRQAMRIKPDWPSPLDSLASLLATTSDPGLRDPNQAIVLARRAVELTQRGNASMLDTLASAYAAAGRFDDAVTTAQAALDQAIADMNYKLAAQIRKNLQLYKQQKTL
jgi:tetratricopeptide (TPR) repeat protein